MTLNKMMHDIEEGHAWRGGEYEQGALLWALAERYCANECYVDALEAGIEALWQSERVHDLLDQVYSDSYTARLQALKILQDYVKNAIWHAIGRYRSNNRISADVVELDAADIEELMTGLNDSECSNLLHTDDISSIAISEFRTTLTDTQCRLYDYIVENESWTTREAAKSLRWGLGKVHKILEQIRAKARAYFLD